METLKRKKIVRPGFKRTLKERYSILQLSEIHKFNPDDCVLINEWPIYIICKDGRIFSKLTGKQKHFYIQQNKRGRLGRQVVRLNYKGNTKLFYLYRLLAEHFIPNPDNKPQVNHKDGNPGNFSLHNLEWVTGKENCIHAYQNNLSKATYKNGYQHSQSRMTHEKLSMIFSMKESGMSVAQIAQETGYVGRHIYHILNKKVWTS